MSVLFFRKTLAFMKAGWINASPILTHRMPTPDFLSVYRKTSGLMKHLYLYHAPTYPTPQ